jgi:hypothetical protein
MHIDKYVQLYIILYQYIYIYIDCVLFIRHPDDSHSSDSKLLVKKNV